MNCEPKKAARDQGFDLAYDESPIDTPEGWHDGSVHQTGGMVMVRIWQTWDGTKTDKSREVEFECAYGQDPNVAIQRYEWNDNGYYDFAGLEKSRQVKENTDKKKAEVARELMEEFERED